ncbi:MAG: Rieske 2Fe-2S domain-containing protein [Rhodocyclaceae bacterium]
MDRRRFVKLCGGSAAMLAAGLKSVRAEPFVDFPRVRLVDAAGAPLKAASLATGDAYVFHFPVRSFPCFLINLGKPAGAPREMTSEAGSYTWPGAVGPQKNVVAYSAVCTHELTYPSKAGSEIRYAAAASPLSGKPGMIVCCAHDSVFDPAEGAPRLHGEARDPLLPVRLEHDPADDAIYATGLAATWLLERFLKSYRRDLIAEYGAGTYKEPVGESAAAIPLAQYAGGLVSTC